MDDRRRPVAAPRRARLQRVEILREPDRPLRLVRVAVRGRALLVIRRLVVDDVELTGGSGGRPREDLRALRRRDAVRAFPRLAVIGRERVVDRWSSV